ncbi:nucleoporin-domain-containing protein [Coemansia reversa NRRL 1564]|uniref:Nucleoporin-domain-containing protein n=1 Tax=Coemansia reversa (strain ATCC 12441 / NRRL 1564) TaxID=763665 RepID=A0A2G5BCU2_COERN|nr:nucleoporin-domain-containing protein [Coemansia reversa NRRL 1564]|eukprot:PIA16802.1 nucleoporin-domain-containing protein [Coemansia reversa NRRL 1564]
METTTNSDTPLLKAAELIEEKQQVDGKFPVISELLHASSSGEYEVAIPAEWQVVTKQRLIPLPDALFEQYDLLECRCFMGLFPDIRRAWITVDHRLFLWNYEDESDFYSFEDQEQIIVSVAMVKPKPGVFVDSIKHVLVVATPLEVFLLGVSYNIGRLGGARGDGGEVTLYATQISVPADGVAMTSVVGTADGRVFMSGNDGALYEFVYQSEDGWLTKKARKVCLTSTITSYFIPTFLAHKREIPALSMVTDDERKLLYVLLQDASIKVYWLGTQGTEFILAHHHRSISNSAALLCPQFNEGTDATPFEIASMHVITTRESRTLSFVAITSGGCRLYFSTVKRMQRFYENSTLPTLPVREPDVFEVVHVRLPPDSQPSLGGGLLQSRAMRQMLNVHTAFYRNGSTIMAHTWNEDHDSIVGTAPGCAQILARIARQPRASLVEMSSVERIEGRTWAIAEVGLGEDIYELNDLVTVSSTPTRTFAVLTNAGVTILEKQRPVDMFRALIAQPTLRDAQLQEFITTYGLDETCAMCYTILCTEEFSQQMVSIQVLNAARRILFEYGGVPHFAETSAFGTNAVKAAAQAGNINTSSADSGVSVAERVLLSGRHNGLVIYLSRALQPIWKKHSITAQVDNVSSPRLHVGISTSDLVDVQERLRRLQHFINNNQRFVPDQINQMPVQPANSNLEAASLGALYELIIYSVEAIAFLCLLADFNLPAISSNMPAGQLKTLSGIEFNQLVCGERGRLACKELILVLINSQLKQHMSIDSLSDVLSKRCSSMFSAADVSLYKALESLKLAGECEEGTETNDLAAEALNLLTDIAGTLSIVQLREICNSFETLGQFGAVVTLSLACAAQSDPNNEAMAFWNDGAPENDSREIIYRKRLDCYKCIIDMLDKRKDTALNVKNLTSLPNTDGLFQFALYDWLLENDKSSLLFHMHGPFVEQYLIVEPRTVEKTDMLWHYYIHCDQFGKASFVQRELACSRDYNIDLSRRIEYLSLSISNAKIAVDMVREEEINELGTLLRENEDQLEIAQVQLEIQQQLRSMGDHETHANALDRRLFTVTELYDKFAEPLRLWDAILLIFKASNHEDSQMVEEVWRIILRTVLDDSQRTGLMAVASKVANLGSRLYPSAAAFPLQLIAGILVELSQERANEYIVGFVGDTLVQARVPHWAVFEVLNKLYMKNAAGPQSNSTVAELLAKEVASLTISWMESNQSGSIRDIVDSPNLVDDGMPVMDVDSALSQYIINATLNNNIDLKNELQRAQERLRRVF